MVVLNHVAVCINFRQYYSSLYRSDDKDSIKMRNQGYGAMNDQQESTPLNPKGPGLAPTVAFVRRQPKDYKFGSILVSVFCFFPVGLIALYFSYQVSKFYLRGDLDRSVTSSERTKSLIQITVVIGCLIWFGAIFGLLYTTY
ncbi:synapse differentiation-inducing gene protein 1-like [Mytilus edulis]|uniref:synapse differentiation-inducing gene protein 1-like n=1 Tax=Mytilus edulis TaxID=6550 RepID=UPI0039F0661A